LLIRHGADMTAKAAGGTPLEKAVTHENVKLINVFLSAGQELDIKSLVRLGKTSEVAKILKDQPWLVKPPNDFLNTAAWNGNMELVKLLLSHGADPNYDKGSRWRSGRSTALSSAIMGSHYEMTKLLFDHGATPEVSAYIGKMDVSLIHYTVSQRDLRFMRLVLSHGADVNTWGSWGKLTPLHVAVRMNDLERVKLLLEYKANINADTGDGATPLFFAALNGHKELCEFLLSEGALLDFFSACALGKGAEVEKMLINTPGLASTPDKRIHREPIFYAVMGEIPEVVELLLNRGANVNARGPDYSQGNLTVYASSTAWKVNVGETPLHAAGRATNSAAIARLLVDSGADVEARDNDGETPLHLALEHGNEKVARILLDAKADVNAETKHGWTPLTKAIHSCPNMLRPLLDRSPTKKTINDAFGAVHVSERKDEFVTLLLDHGGVPDFCSSCILGFRDRVAEFLKTDPSLARAPRGENAKRAPLYLVAEHGHAGIVKLLVTSGAELDAPKGADAPLHIAARNGHLNVVTVLLAVGADVNMKNYAGLTALHQAAKGGHTDIIEFLLAHKAKLLAGDSHGASAIHKAAESGALDAVKFLIEKGIPVDAKDKYDRTPLHKASARGQVEMTALLLSLGADTTAEDYQGKTPLETATGRMYYRHPDLQKNRENVAKLLRKQGDSKK
jgi:ankyrin repeat protein